MRVDRYVKIVLTVIALELFWIGVNGSAPQVLAQAQPQPTPVVIRGIELNRQNPGFLPVIEARPLRIEEVRPVKVEIDHPVTVEVLRPLLVENVGYTPSQTPR
jgi:hypothetical protein